MTIRSMQIGVCLKTVLFLTTYLLTVNWSLAQKNDSRWHDTWTADNGNGTYTNPIFYEEFSDPNLIRIGDDYYLTGMTMHAMPGLPVLHSRDLVNWEFLSYACENLNFGHEYRLEDGKDIYGRGIGPESYAVTELDISHLQTGDVAGLALLNLPYAWIGIVKDERGHKLQFYNQQEQERIQVETDVATIWLKADCNFDNDTGKLRYSFDGINFIEIGGEIIMPYQLKTFQGVRYALFHFNTRGHVGGFVDFNSFNVMESRYQGLTRPIPYNQIISLRSIADGTVLVNWKYFLRPVDVNSKLADGKTSSFKVLDRGNGRIALQSVVTGGFVTVKGLGGMAEIRIEAEDRGEASTFQWQDMLKDDIMLMSLYTHKNLFADPFAGSLCSADAAGARPDRKGGACFTWTLAAN